MEKNNFLFKKSSLMILIVASSLNVSLVLFLNLVGVKIRISNLPKVQQTGHD